MNSLKFFKKCKGQADLIEPFTLARAYDADRHPEVLAGRASATRTRAEFLDTFDLTDGTASFEAFERYHCLLSAAIRADAYFALLVRSVWRPRDERISQRRILPLGVVRVGETESTLALWDDIESVLCGKPPDTCSLCVLELSTVLQKAAGNVPKFHREP